MFAPAGRRDALFALAAFNGELARIREKISEPLIGEMRLQFWRDAIEALYAGRAHANPVARALGEAIGRYDLSRAPLDDLIDARAADLDDGPPDDYPALEGYARGTGGTLARLSLEVLGVKGDLVDEAADHAGIAWALTGLLRAARFHAANGRVYLPADLLAAHGINADDVRSGNAGSRLAHVAEAMADRALGHIRKVRALRHRLPVHAVPGLLLAKSAEIYLGRLRRAQFDLMEANWPTVRPPVARLAFASLRNRY
jgi:phytoene synthase